MMSLGSGGRAESLGTQRMHYPGRRLLQRLVRLCRCSPLPACSRQESVAGADRPPGHTTPESVLSRHDWTCPHVRPLKCRSVELLAGQHRPGSNGVLAPQRLSAIRRVPALAGPARPRPCRGRCPPRSCRRRTGRPRPMLRPARTPGSRRCSSASIASGCQGRSAA
jgi:hypothetical protein